MDTICEVAKIITKPGAEYAELLRFWQGCPTIAGTPKGRLFAGWYSGGTGEPSAFNYNILVRSDDEGLTWSAPEMIVASLPERQLRAIDIELWLDPDGRLWLFWTQRDDKLRELRTEGHLSTWAIVCDDPDAATLSWSAPSRISEGFLRCQPTVLSDGRWLLPAYDWLSDNYAYSESSDKGRTWRRRHGGRKAPKTFFDEGIFLERRDKSLLMMARAGEGFIAETESFDGGETWSDGRPGAIVAPSSRLFLRRLPSGRVLLVRNAHSTERLNMTVSLSEDDGRTWSAGLLLDERNTSYPDAAISPDGTVFIIYDRGRTSEKEILLARATEEDILAGELKNPKSFIKKIVSKAPETPCDQTAFDAAKEKDKLYWEAFKKFNEET